MSGGGTNLCGSMRNGGAKVEAEGVVGVDSRKRSTKMRLRRQLMQYVILQSCTVSNLKALMPGLSIESIGLP